MRRPSKLVAQEQNCFELISRSDKSGPWCPCHYTIWGRECVRRVPQGTTIPVFAM